MANAAEPRRRRRWWAWALAALALVAAVGLLAFWDDVMRTGLDPKVPFQTYDPPPAPNYATTEAWHATPQASADMPVDVFFIGPTTYDGGDEWNAPIDDREAERLFRRVMAPNYAGPFVRVGRLVAPRYRQASLYSQLTLREDAREARRFAYSDIQAAFRTYLARDPNRPFLLVGVEQGGLLAERLLREEVAPRPDVSHRLVAAYLIETLMPAADAPIAPCSARGQTGCLAAWASVAQGDFERRQRLLDRSVAWTPAGDLDILHGRRPLCFNPILGETTDALAPARLHLGAANATGLEWDARPAFMARQVSAQCEDGILTISRPKSSTLRRTGDWANRRKAPGYNLFYADLEADAKARVAAMLTAASLRP